MRRDLMSRAMWNSSCQICVLILRMKWRDNRRSWLSRWEEGVNQMESRLIWVNISHLDNRIELHLVTPVVEWARLIHKAIHLTRATFASLCNTKPSHLCRLALHSFGLDSFYCTWWKAWNTPARLIIKTRVRWGSIVHWTSDTAWWDWSSFT